MKRPAQIVFAALVAATVAAFFVAQNLKNSPSVIQQLTFRGFFSPNGDGRFDTLRINFKLKEADDVTVAMVDGDGDLVRTLLDDRALEAYSPFAESLRWDGRDEDGRRAPDGRYRIRITLRRQGRSIFPPKSVRLDTTPPRPLVASMGPVDRPTAELLPLPGGGEATARFAAPAGRRGRILLFKTAPQRPRRVLTVGLAEGATEWRWDGTIRGRRASAGTYLVVVEWRDQAGNVGTSVHLDGRGLPELPRGRGLPGRGGITVRSLGVQPPSEPVLAREPATFFIDARGARYTWAIRKVGTPRPVKRGRGTRVKVVVQAPGGISGLYLFTVRTRRFVRSVPFAVQARRRRPTLVVLPLMTWQGRNPSDDDGDGAPDTLDRGVGVRPDRVLATPDGLPRGLAVREAPVLAWLDRTGRRYDLTTDLALARGHGPRLPDHRGVLLPGDTRWLTQRVREQLRAFVRRGGTLVSLGADSLRRSVAISPAGRLVNPSPPRSTDLFGSRLRPVARTLTALTVLDDEIGFFEGTTGRFENITVWEETARAGRELQPVATAVTEQPLGRTVTLAGRFGRGLVIRPGIPDLATRLTPDPAIAALMARMWTLLSR